MRHRLDALPECFESSHIAPRIAKETPWSPARRAKLNDSRYLRTLHEIFFSRHIASLIPKQEAIAHFIAIDVSRDALLSRCGFRQSEIDGENICRMLGGSGGGDMCHGNSRDNAE